MVWVVVVSGKVVVRVRPRVSKVKVVMRPPPSVWVRGWPAAVKLL